MDIVSKLQMNLHPKDTENLSFVTATNVKLSNDGSCITNEESIRENEYIKRFIENIYLSVKYNIVGIIPCNNELIIITNAIGTDKTLIFRYREKDRKTKVVYQNLKYYGGEIKGTFTYNVEDSLIIAIAEYKDNKELIPLRTINLGNFDDEKVINDRHLLNSQISVSPEVYIPSLTNIEYIKGNSYKGWYYLFIRYKINSVDYTQWFNFGQPIYVDTIDKYNIIKYAYKVDKIVNLTTDVKTNKILAPKSPKGGLCTGIVDYISNKTDIANETFKAEIKFYNNIYDKYQIGIICTSKSYTKGFRTSDIVYNKYSKENNVFIFNKDILIENATNEFITDNYNYFNVKNIINYNNRLYISNYKENDLNDKSISNNLINNINVRLVKENIKLNDNFYNITICRKSNDDDVYANINSNQYDTKENYILLSDFLNISPDTIITVNGANGKRQIVNNITFFDDSITIEDRAKNFRIYNRNVYISFQRNENSYEISSEIVKVDDYITLVNIKESIGYIWYFYDTITIRYNSLGKEIRNIINLDDYAIHKSSPVYTNVNNSFNKRRLKCNLIPGEVYNFFIHFVDKYGHSTNGYKIENKIKWIGDNNEEIVPIPFKYNDVIYYAGAKIDSNVLDDGILNTHDIIIYTKIVNIGNNNYLNNSTLDKNVLDAFKETYSNFVDDKYKELKWFQLTTGYECNNFIPYYNSNGDKLFRVPIAKNNGIIKSSSNKPHDLEYTLYTIDFTDINIPDGYIGYFISYEKFEPINRCVGILTRNDFFTINGNGNNNNIKSNLMYFYTSKFDIDDSIKLDYNILRIDDINILYNNDLKENYFQLCDNYKYCIDNNKPQIYNEHTDCPILYPMPDYKLCIADSASDDRVGLGTALEIKDSYGLFNFDNVDINIYKVTLMNINRNIYVNKNKILIRCSDIIYDITKDKNIYLNGHITYDGVIVYNSNGVSFNTGDNILRRSKVNVKYYPEEINIIGSLDKFGKFYYTKEARTYPFPAFSYIQFPVIDNYFYESKSFKNEPKGYIYYVERDSEDTSKGNENNKFASGCMVAPADSIDLFENRQVSIDKLNPKTYSNYRDDLPNIEQFNKTIRRSAIIKDESRENNWRIFPIESYKNITENKGKITNLIGIGSLILVHTEHSLFMFSTDNTLETNNQNIQLLQPDAFDVKYREVFTSDLGYGGLQDTKAAIVDQFGYIFYNNDSNRFYNFDNGKLNIIDADIVQWLHKYKPYNIRFANDKYNNRLLIKLNYDVNNNTKDIVLSYNYSSNEFISNHSYYFDEAYNTKTRLYLKCNEHIGCNLHEFVHDDSSFGSFDNVKNNIGIKTTCSSKIGIIVNEQYYNIKYLEHISYKLNKIAGKEVDYVNYPVEGMMQPYSADFIRIYNDQVDTGILNITVDKEDLKNIFGNYDKPYWQLGNWNFNYLRNKLVDRKEYGDAYNMSRIFGNYFIIEFTFSNKDNLKVEFEGIKYKINRI